MPGRWLAADRYTGGDHACCGAGCDHASHDHAHGHTHDPSHGHAGGHLHGIRSFALTFERPLDGRSLEAIIGATQMVYGPKILRLKGIVAIEGEELPIAIHGVNQSFYPTEQLPAWPGRSGARGSCSSPRTSTRRRSAPRSPRC